MFSGSFYWQLPLLRAPFVIAYVLAISKPTIAILLVFIIILLRFLGGYEYASSLILSPLGALAIRCAFGEIKVSRAVKQGIFFGIAGTAAFGTTIAAHLAALCHETGSWEKGIKLFENVVNYRTVGVPLGRDVTLRNDIIVLSYSFFSNESILVIGMGAVSVALVLFSRGRATAVRLGLALLFAFLCSLSWQVLARGHMRDHNHINFIAYFIPFGLAVYVAFSRVVGDLLEHRNPQWAVNASDPQTSLKQPH